MLTTSIRLSNFIRTRPIRARTGFHPASETAAVRAETPMRGARPTGPKNPPGACGATPLPERARTGAAIPPAKLHWRTWVWGPARQIRINKNLAPLHASFPMGRRRRRRRRYETVSNPCGPRRSPPPSRPEAGTSPQAFPRPPPQLLQPRGGGGCQGDAPGTPALVSPPSGGGSRWAALPWRRPGPPRSLQIHFPAWRPLGHPREVPRIIGPRSGHCYSPASRSESSV